MGLTGMQARKRLVELLPALPGWTVHMDVAPGGATPPWVVVRISDDTSMMSEGLSVTTRLTTIDIRVVAEHADSICVICDKLQQALDGARPGAPFSAIVPDRDSGIYPSELISNRTSKPYLMRVLTWRVGRRA